MPFRNPLALLGLLSVIPLIILYLIRPRPKEHPFPSLLFLSQGEAERSAVVRRLITDPLFWIQLLVLILLSTAAAGPYTVSPGVPGDHLVLVMDLSASMEASFLKAEEIASSYTQGYNRVSVVLAESVPIVALQEGSSAEARDVLKRIAPRALSADLSSAMRMAEAMLGAEGGKVLVVSDFLSWRGDDPGSTRQLLEANGVQVVFEDSGGSGDNLGIVGGWIAEDTQGVNYTCLVHNYGAARLVPIKVKGPGGTTTRSVELEEDGDYYLSVHASFGLTTVSLEVDDGVSADNAAYIFSPPQSPKKVLYFGEDGPSLAALKSLPNVEVRTSEGYQGFDLVVVSKNSSGDGDLNRYIEGGGNVVYVAWNSSDSPEFLPVKISGYVKGDGYDKLWTRNPGFATDIHFDEIGVFGYLDTESRRRSVTLVEANSYPILSYWTLGRGKVVFLGVGSDFTDFYQRPEYPLFWYKMVNWLAGVPDLSESNRKTGEVVPLGEKTIVETPGGRTETSALLLDQTGIFRLQGRTLVANLYDPQESDLRGGLSFLKGEFKAGATREKMIETDFASWLIALGGLLILLELAIIKWRREM